MIAFAIRDAIVQAAELETVADFLRIDGSRYPPNLLPYLFWAFIFFQFHTIEVL
jgi:hypothetical protein